MIAQCRHAQGRRRQRLQQRGVKLAFAHALRHGVGCSADDAHIVLLDFAQQELQSLLFRLVELGYFGDTFKRPAEIDLPWWDDDAEPNADLWATAEESRDEIVDLYRRAWDHADETIGFLDLEARGHVPWWPEGRDEVTLHRVLVHVATETHRHAGHADIVRELIDGSAGLRPGQDNLWAGQEEGYWDAHRERVEAAAREAQERAAG